MKLLIRLPNGDLYGAGDKRYLVKLWKESWPNSCGITFHGEVDVFTSGGWMLLFRHKSEYKYTLPRTYSDKETRLADKAEKAFAEELLTWVIAFNDG